jgi:type VI protein secretion system component VasK
MQFSDALYGSAGTEPRLTFALKPAFSPEIQSVTITIDGQRAAFTGDTPAVQFSWPGDGVQMTVKSGDTYPFPSYEGPWGVFDFFYDADKPAPSPEWVLRAGRQGKPFLSPATNQPIAVHFDLDMLGNPQLFQKGYLQELACVADVAAR